MPGKKPSALALLQAGLLGGGVALLVAFVLLRVDQAEMRDLGLEAFHGSQSELHLEATPEDPEFGSSLAVPDQTLWSEKRVEAYRQSLASGEDVPLAVLSIDRLNVEVPVFDGADEINLNRGVARIKGTASVTAPGNLGIAGHRDGFFRGLKDAQEGDLIRLRTHEAVVAYRVTDIVIVDPSEVSVLDPTDERSLTLVTCYPFYFVGQAPKRFIVKARAEEYSPSDAQAPRIETWRMEVQLPEVILPVQLQLAEDFSLAWFVNGAERVAVPEVSKEAEGLELRFPSFNNTLTLQVSEDRLTGELVLVKRGYEQRMPVTATRGMGYRFAPDPKPSMNVTGRWEVVFTDDEGVTTQAVGEFDQQGSKLIGTFLTPLGDHRYLEGEVDGNTLKLSVFDGAHAYVFTAEQDSQGVLRGDFWSGTHWHESWVAKRNFEARLPDPYALTYLKPGFDALAFTFPDLEGKPVSLSDEKYRGKVVLVTLSGTWCPNCADEVAFLSPWYTAHRERGLEIITLLYEHFEDFDKAATQGKALRDEYGIAYDLLVAGTSDKTQASETLPMLDRVLAFPTMIFIDRKGRVRKIHTGFSGPATGRHYTDFVAAFESTMDELLAEQP